MKLADLLHCYNCKVKHGAGDERMLLRRRDIQFVC